jgi:hypothetical protein
MHKPQVTWRFLDLTPLKAGERIVPAKLDGELSTEFSDLHMIANDLSFAIDCFREAHKIGIPDASNLHSKALIFSAVTAYTRPFKTGVRQLKMGASYFEIAASFDPGLHNYLISIRDKHIAHSVNEFEQSASIGIMVGLPPAKWRPAGVGVTKFNSIGITNRIVEASIIQIEAMLNLIQSRIDEIRPQLFIEFREKFEKDGKWEMAPLTIPNRDNVSTRRS